MLHVCLCVITLIQLTSSQSTYDVIQQHNDVSSCGHTDQLLSQLVTAVSRIEMTMARLVTDVSTLQSDVAELKAVNQQEITGRPIRESRRKSNTILNVHLVEASVHN